MVSGQIIAYLKLLHAVYNFTMMVLFLRQGRLGLQIRKGRLAGSPPFQLIKRHRRNGPVLAFMGVCGFLSGVIIVGLDSGELLKYYYHFLVGLALSSLIVTTFVVSKRIKGPVPYWRNIHLAIGLLIICFYVVQLFMGLNVLL
ncbi:MAG: DUF4079 family protein [Thermodesulfovibrionales bacterium]|nr:DUF4079 family protein [Thermodesulfovibrionales bacterium]